MTCDGTNRFLRSSGIAFVRIIILLTGTACLSVAQQNQPVLQIIAPADGTVVNPGQVITVNVASPAGVAVSAIFIVGEDPIGVSDGAPSTPAQLSITIPANLASSRKYMLTAFGASNAGQVVYSATILVDVERSDSPTNLSADSQQIILESQGQQFPVRISGTFSDGSVLDLTESSNVVYRSSDTGIATVDANGIAIAVATGRASLTSIYGQGTQN